MAVPRVLLDWRDEPGRLSRNHPAYSLAAFRTCRVHHLRKSVLKGRSGVVVWGAGPTGKSLAREFARQGVSVQAFIEVDPRKIGQQIHGAPVLGVEAARGAVGGGGGVGVGRGVGGVAGALHVGAVARSAGREAVRGAVGGAGLGWGGGVRGDGVRWWVGGLLHKSGTGAIWKRGWLLRLRQQRTGIAEVQPLAL